ncbi:hypothetical protein NDU88_006376 [Pleurodeles waltl]|uniref:Uncharacterized protein n=1 Tax=Pleurodeles waltl TaxID=8319 RepID=A0AAV7UPT6_PLEWA|nr:hypothetical protein NDU88_006376 [Pleurodeles waltl]
MGIKLNTAREKAHRKATLVSSQGEIATDLKEDEKDVISCHILEGTLLTKVTGTESSPRNPGFHLQKKEEEEEDKEIKQDNDHLDKQDRIQEHSRGYKQEKKNYITNNLT